MKPTVLLINYDVKSLIEAIKTYRNVSDKKALQLLDKLWKRGHYSPYEFATFTWRIENISAVALRHITRHRTFKFACSSNRHKTAEWLIENFSNCNELYEYSLSPIELLPEELQKYIPSINISFTTDKKLSNDKLIYLTPATYRYTLTLMTDLRNLVNFFVQRLHKTAHHEIRNIAKQMYEQITKIEIIKNINLPIWISREWTKYDDMDEIKLKNTFDRTINNI